MGWGAIAAAVAPAVLGAGGSLLDKSANERAAKNARRDQLNAAKHGLGWRVKDAMAHGLSPLVGAGASTTSISPTSVGGDSTFGDMGQNIGRAAQAMMPKSVDAATQELNKLGLERAQLQNELLKSQITNINARTAGSSEGGPVVTKQSEQDAAMQGAKYLEAADKSPGWKSFVTGDNTRMVVPSERLKQSIEDSPYETLMFAGDYLSRLGGGLTDKKKRPGERFNPLTGEYEQSSSDNWLRRAFRNYYSNRHKRSNRSFIPSKY